MKMFIVFAVIVAAAMAASVSDSEVTIVESEQDVGPESYAFKTVLSDGSEFKEDGHLINVGTDDESSVVRGAYKYTAPDGQVISVSYIADENGFQPTGEHLP